MFKFLIDRILDFAMFALVVIIPLFVLSAIFLFMIDESNIAFISLRYAVNVFIFAGFLFVLSMILIVIYGIINKEL